MPEPISDNRRIAKNTLVLYIRMFFVVVVGLYTSRVVLEALGVEDYGIYGVVGGIVGMLGFLNSSMSVSTSRFITFELGKGDKDRLAKTFASAVVIHYIIAGIVVLLAETIGLWYLCEKMVIPAERMFAAHCVFQLSIISAFLTITQVPYNATIIAHEKMNVYAYVEIINVALKLAIVFLLSIGNFDKLIFYAALMFAVSVIIRIIYRVYAIRRFNECKFRWLWDKSYIRPLLSFSLWALYPNFCFTSRQQGINLILNLFGGAVVNAASALATTVYGIIEQFSTNVLTASRPPIIKLFAQKQYDETIKLTRQTAAIASLLFGIVAIPVIFECDYLLSLWLVEVPPYTSSFCILLLISAFFSLNNNCLFSIIQASGNIKTYSFTAGTTSLMVLPILYVVLNQGGSFNYAYILSACGSFAIYFYCLYNVKQIIPNLRIVPYVFTSLIKSLICFSLPIALIMFLQAQFAPSLLRTALVILTSIIGIGGFGVLLVIPRHVVVQFISKLRK